MHYIGVFVGALVPTGFLTFILSWSLRSIIKTPIHRLLAANALSLTIVTTVAGFNFGGDSPRRFGMAFFLYLLPQIVWFVVGYVIQKVRSRSDKPT